ncbi:MAG TPA: hypothetical protein VFT30_03695, partial [Nitrospira sp.]|nr:hypothetical protein [Nitrospira sp.]
GFETNLSRKDRQEANIDKSLELHGYRETMGYAYSSGPSLGTAMAISGAAANPNSGYHTSAPMAFLLTVFNVRLGWWLGNPRRRGPSKEPGPRFALWYMFADLFAQSNSRSHFINLSDGGHFDNIGLYELIRRRCRYIIVGDSEEDGKLTFSALGDAIRRCRADFGVEIDLDPTPVQTKVNGFSKKHCVVGTIHYPEQETGIYAGVCDGQRAAEPGDHARGWILYIKSSLTGDEPSDVLEYQSRCPNFPHQSTGDQFFSESQFESYRRLGLHIGRDAFEEIDRGSSGSHNDLLNLFQGLARKWYAPIPVSEEAATRLANEYSALVRRIGEDENLRAVFGSLLQEQPPGATPPAVNELATSFGLELVQHMENVFTEFRFEHGLNRANPRNAG